MSWTMRSTTATRLATWVLSITTGWLAFAALAGRPDQAAADWPTYRHDAARSGVTEEGLRLPLAPSWVFRALSPPQPAWGDPKPKPVENILELRRIHFDDAFQPVVADGKVYFGSSVDGKLYCLDAQTGRILWTRRTGGPVRLAPTVADGKVYVGSDDGCAYCFTAAEGTPVWKFTAAPEPRQVLGNGRMISLWPVRTGVLVDDGTAYFAAGIFPGERVFFYAVDAETGTEQWRNDTTSEKPQSRVAPQGYLLASATRLYVPMGRTSPAAFDRDSGKLLYESYFGKPVGGTYALLAGDAVYTGTEEFVAYDQESRDKFATFAGRKMLVRGDTAYLATDTQLIAMDRTKKKEQWKVDCPCHEALIMAGDLLLAGGPNLIAAFDAVSGEPRWQAEVEGTCKGLAVADGRLWATTDSGRIYCFGAEGVDDHGEITPPIDGSVYDDSPGGKALAAAAEQILAKTGTRRGYALVLDCRTGRLACELARRSDLMIYCVAHDGASAENAREKLDAAGLYGHRVRVDVAAPEAIPYSDYFADLIVFEGSIVDGKLPAVPAAHAARMLKPRGGKLCLGQPGELPEATARLNSKALRNWIGKMNLAHARRAEADAGSDGTWAVLTRGELPGAGDWTHLYANPGNTACSDDQRVKAPLGVLWFGRPGPGNMVNRHRRAAGPLAFEGRMFVQGQNVLMAFDAYNGLELWRRELPGAMRIDVSHQSSNLTVNRHGLFIAIDGECLRLDPATGKTVSKYAVPPGEGKKPYRWGYLASVGDRLFGSRSDEPADADMLFAVDIETGNVAWKLKRTRVAHSSISIGQGRLYFVDQSATPEQREKVIESLRNQTADLSEADRAQAERDLAAADVRIVAAVDTTDGKLRWEKPIDVTHAGGGPGGYHAKVSTMTNQGVLVVFGVYLDGHYWKQFFAGQFDRRQIYAIDGASGRQLWTRRVGYRVRPLIIDDTLHAEPWAFDLHSGAQRTRENPITGETDHWQFARPGHHCGCPAAAPNCMFFRSWNLGYYDLIGDYGTMHFGAQRPGCWINFIPAGGLLLMPEASAGCMCAFPNMCTVVFQPTDENKAWAWYSTPGRLTPVKRLGLNLGAPGDRRDADDHLWLGFPRRSGSLLLTLDTTVGFYPGGSYRQENSVYTEIQQTEKPWLFASSAYGIRSCTIPVTSAADGEGVFDVRLLLAEPEDQEPGTRWFDVVIQGDKVGEDVDPLALAGGPRRATSVVYRGIESDGKLTIELVAKTPQPSPQEMPIVYGVEITRRKILSLGCATSGFTSSTMKPKHTASVQLANLREEPFEGTLALSTPEGFRAKPATLPVDLAPGAREEFSPRIEVADGVPAGDYEIGVALRRPDGGEELTASIPVEHLGRRGRIALKAVEDCYAVGRYPDKNFGTVTVLRVDGGNPKMGDQDHSLSYLKFAVDVPGKPLSVKLRLHNASNPSGNSGRICLVENKWRETTLSYQNRPKPGEEVAQIGPVAANQIIELPLDVDLEGKDEVSFVIDPTSTDGLHYMSRESGLPPELIVDYEPTP